MTHQTRRAAFFNLSTELLRQALYMPEETNIIGADWDFAGNCLRVYIEHPDLKEVSLGEILPIIRPTLIKDPVFTGIDETGGTQMHFRYIWKFNQEAA